MKKDGKTVIGDRNVMALAVLDDPKSRAILEKCSSIDGGRLAMFLAAFVATENCPKDAVGLRLNWSKREK